MCPDKETRSNTSITFQITEEWFTKMDETKQRINYSSLRLQALKVHYVLTVRDRVLAKK